MSKASASDCDGEKTVHSEISHGGYYTADEEVELPNYLVQLQSHNDVIVDIDEEEELS